MRKSPCKWLERDENGRPRCKHGWALGEAQWGFRCPEKHAVCIKKYESSKKGKASRKKYEQTEGRREGHNGTSRDWKRLNK